MSGLLYGNQHGTGSAGTAVPGGMVVLPGARDAQGVPLALYSPKLRVLARSPVKANVFPSKAYGASSTGQVGTRYGQAFSASMHAQAQRTPRLWNAWQIKHG